MLLRFAFSLRVIRSALAVAVLAPATFSYAHQEIQAALDRLNAAILAAPTDANLYLERGELYAQHGEWLPAEANYLRAAELAPNLPRLNRARGALALVTREFTDARAQLDRALTLDARDAEALILRSRLRAEINDPRAALLDLDAALALLPNPRPELFLERAALMPSPAAAIRSLDEAMRRIGAAHTLQLRALELEESSGRIDAAVARINLIAERSERQEAWLKRRGDVLARAGRAAEAREAYRAALTAIAALPEWLRNSPATRQLIAELHSASTTS